MIIGVPKEIKDKEFRVALVPAGVMLLQAHGHTVLVEKDAGRGSGIDDQEYVAAGAMILDSAAAVFARADLIVKVKEPLAAEYPLLREDQVLFTYLHLAPLPELTALLLARKVAAIGYETVQLDDGRLPLLQPMSEIAGRMSIQVGAHYLEKENGGRGILLGGASGIEPGQVTILGSGTVGRNAAKMARGLGASVTVLGRNPAHLAALCAEFHDEIKTILSSPSAIADELEKTDLLVGGVLVPGAAAPKLVSRSMLARMKTGTVIVDVAIDQGGCIETARPTTHSDPVFIVDGIIHYCVANMPGAVPRTSTFALTKETLPYLLEIADKGLRSAAADNIALRRGINTLGGKLCSRLVAEAQGLCWEECGF